MKKCLVFLMAVLILLSDAVAGGASTSATYGYLTDLYYSDGRWVADFDQLSFTFKSNYSTDFATRRNDSDQITRLPLAEHCMLYSDESGITVRCDTPQDFLNRVAINTGCFIIYIDDEIVTIAATE